MPFDATGVSSLEDTSLSMKQALDIIGGLSSPSKMPGHGWSISAKTCQTGAKLAQHKGSICSVCYALKGRYTFPHVQAALDRRLEASHGPRFVGAFIRALNLKNRHGKHPYFRWFDSGDIQSVEMLSKICLICLGTPGIQHWMPTKEPRLVGQFLKNGGQIPPNLQIRISHPMLGQRFKTAPLGMSFSTAGLPDQEDIHDCPAHLQGNQCGDCRACWEPGHVNYRTH